MELQGSLLDLAGTRAEETTATFDRVELDQGAWVELARGWLPQPEALFDRLRSTVPWRSERRTMFERVVDVPRLVAFYAEDDALPDEELKRARARLDARYGSTLGEPFATTGLCLYRNGRDSVAWHGDTRGRGRHEDTIVAICSLGTPRRFLLRPITGGPSCRYLLGPGDLLVMGGSCQRTWQHAVPKTAARQIGPRISIQFRPTGVS